MNWMNNKRFVERMKKLGVDDVKGYIDRHIVIIPNGHHIDLHGAGWNKDWSDWVSKNRAFELKDLQAQVKKMMKEYNVPKNSRNFAKKYGKN